MKKPHHYCPARPPACPRGPKAVPSPPAASGEVGPCPTPTPTPTPHLQKQWPLSEVRSGHHPCKCQPAKGGGRGERMEAHAPGSRTFPRRVVRGAALGGTHLTNSTSWSKGAGGGCLKNKPTPHKAQVEESMRMKDTNKQRNTKYR